MSTQYTSSTPLKIGTRGSPLALVQAHETRARLMAAHDMPEAAFEVVVIETTGDAVQDRPLSEIGGKGLFTKEIEIALMDGRIDIAVHSMKDVATVLPDGLEISTVLPREDVRDAFISLKYNSIADLPIGATVGSSSIRRRAQLLTTRPDLKLVEFRGNVQTRLRKLDEGVADATFLACAGLSRLGRTDIAKPIAVNDMLPAVAQGAVGIEQRVGDRVISELLRPIHDIATATCITTERAFLRILDGSCRSPIAGLAMIVDDVLHFEGEILRLDGSLAFKDSWQGAVSDAVMIGEQAAFDLKKRAGDDFLG